MQEIATFLELQAFMSVIHVRSAPADEHQHVKIQPLWQGELSFSSASHDSADG